VTNRMADVRMMQWLTVLTFVLLPAWALACPACAGRDGEGIGTIIVVGTMIALPFLIAGVVYLAIRRLVKHSPTVATAGSPKNPDLLTVPVKGAHE
jgi:hypothetical protein